MQHIRYRLVDTELLRRVMRRPARVSPYTIRQLALAAQVGKGTLGHLLTGHQQTVSDEFATRISVTLGVHPLILFAPEADTGVTMAAAGVRNEATS